MKGRWKGPDLEGVQVDGEGKRQGSTTVEGRAVDCQQAKGEKNVTVGSTRGNVPERKVKRRNLGNKTCDLTARSL